MGLLSFKATQYNSHSNKELLILNLGMVKETGDETVVRMVNVKERVSRFYNKKVNPLVFRLCGLALWSVRPAKKDVDRAI